MILSYGTNVSLESTIEGLRQIVNDETERSSAASFLLGKLNNSEGDRDYLGEVLREAALDYSVFIESDFNSAYALIQGLALDVGSSEVKEILDQMIEYDQLP